MSSPAPGPAQTVVLSVSAATLAVLPSMLLAGLALLVREELGFGAFELGAAIATFFAASVVVSVPAGVLSEWIGPRPALLIGAATTATTLAGIGLVASSWMSLLPFMLLGGTANTVTQVATNHLIARRIDSTRLGLAFGVKQSAIPIAGMLAGLSLPILGLSVGWRVAYLMAALAIVPVVLLVRRIPSSSRSRDSRQRTGDAPIRLLILLSVGAGLATGSGNGMTAFTVAAADHAGFSSSAAGLLLMAGSLMGVSVRVSSGWLADRLGRWSLLLAGGLVGIGVLGYLGLALEGPPAWRVVATLVAFGGGWGFPGLILLTIARTNPRSPATAMGVGRLGPSMGAILGPLAFGAIVDSSGYPAAWLAAAGASLASAILLLSARPFLRRYRASPDSFTGDQIPTA